MIDLHSENICHRNIKPENIIFSNDNQNLKFADLRLAVKFENPVGLYNLCGTLKYSNKVINN